MVRAVIGAGDLRDGPGALMLASALRLLQLTPTLLAAPLMQHSQPQCIHGEQRPWSWQRWTLRRSGLGTEVHQASRRRVGCSRSGQSSTSGSSKDYKGKTSF